MELNLLERAIAFAVTAHAGQFRKYGGTPYILHPLEVANIIATMTDNLEVMSAGVLHDTIEDCGVEAKTLRQTFGPRVAALVQSETEDKLADRPANETWMQRKEESLLMLQHTKDREVKILWLGDKLSNIRSFYAAYRKNGDAIWERLHQNDPKMQEWYYRKVADYVSELSDTSAYKEYIETINRLFE